MATLYEDPWTYLLFGLVAEVLLGAALFHTRKGILAVAMGGVVVLVAAGLVLEWLVVTDREAVEIALHEAADAVEAGDAQRVLAMLSDEAEEIREAVGRYVGKMQLEKVSLHGIETSVSRGPPPTARVEFTARVTAGAEAAEYGARKEWLARFEVRLRKEANGWRLTDYQQLKSL